MSETAYSTSQQISFVCPSAISSTVRAQTENNPEQLHPEVVIVDQLREQQLGQAQSSRGPVPASPQPVVDQDLEAKVRRACERISENVHICANEPSLAFYRLSEHVRKALPPTVESRQQVKHIQKQLGGAYQDAEFALYQVHSMEKSIATLTHIQELLKNAVFAQQQIKYEQTRSQLLVRHPAVPSPVPP